MTPAVEELVRETIELTGAAGPELLEEDAPVLSGDAMVGTDAGFYLVGIIGGKDVGKSALVNALVGRNLTAVTSHGPGTESAVAYAHRSQEPELRKLLEREVPGKFRIVTHEEPHLRSQVLLDLPDIDSHFASHPEVTQAMLRHMLFPVWVQSVEKYADRQPQEMLRRVALGNAAANFVFCLNKVDQVEKLEAGVQRLEDEDTKGPVSGPAREIGEDFGRRIGGTLGLGGPQRVFMISAIRPERYDLPELRGLLSRQKSEDLVRQSKALALRRQDQSLLAWVDAQQLGERAERLGRLLRDAQETLATRVGEPLLTSAIPRLSDDPGNRLAMSDEILRRRVSRWPLVNLVHTLLSPLLAVWRSNVGPAGRGGLRGADALVDSYLEGDGEPLSSRVQAAFGQLRSANPLVADLYANDHLWESMPAEAAAADVRRALATTVDRQRAAATESLAGKGGIVAPLFRWLLTIGALLWFPLVQPVLSGFLNSSDAVINWYPEPRRLIGLLVSVVSGEMLLKNTAFLALWFTVIWLALRWRTQRQLARLLDRWASSASAEDQSLNLPAQALQWLRSLVAPIERGAGRVTALADRAKRLRGDADARAA